MQAIGETKGATIHRKGKQVAISSSDPISDAYSLRGSYFFVVKETLEKPTDKDGTGLEVLEAYGRSSNQLPPRVSRRKNNKLQNSGFS